MGFDIGRNAGRVPIFKSPVKTEGAPLNITVDKNLLIKASVPFSIGLPVIDSNGNAGKYVVVSHIGIVSTCTTTSLVLTSAQDAYDFDPASLLTNPLWLALYGGAQKITYWDATADSAIRGVTLTGLGGGDIYAGSTNEAKINSVSSATLTLNAAFTADPASPDVILPGGIGKYTDFYRDAVIIPDPVTLADVAGGDKFTSAMGAGTVLRYEDLPLFFKRLITAGVIPADGCANFRIER